jgi:hypothetical protein
MMTFGDQCMEFRSRRNSDSAVIPGTISNLIAFGQERRFLAPAENEVPNRAARICLSNQFFQGEH